MTTKEKSKPPSMVEKVYPAMSSVELRDVYDEWSETYDKYVDTIYNGPKLIAKRCNEIGIERDAHILDAGCGTGLVGLELSRFGFDNIDGVDMSQRSLDKAREKGIYKKLIRAELGPEPLEGIEQISGTERYTIPKDTYDVIVSAGCFCGESHLNDGCLCEWIRIVKPGGLICIIIIEKYLYLLEGDIFKRLLEDKKIEVIAKVPEEDYAVYGRGFTYVLKKVMSNSPIINDDHGYHTWISLCSLTSF